MDTTNPTEGYRKQLHAELVRRKLMNPRYSLRSFSKAVGLSPAFLSKVLKGERNLSGSAAIRVADRLGYSKEEAREFFLSVKLRDGNGSQVRRDTDASPRYIPLALDAFNAISDWHHYALLSLIECDDFDPSPRKIGRRLGIAPNEVRAAIARLERLGLIRMEKGRYVRTFENFRSPDVRPSSALKNLHLQMISKAARSIDTQSRELRDITAVTMAIDPKMVPVAKEMIAKFRRRLESALRGDKKTAVYQLNIQFFDLMAEEQK